MCDEGKLFREKTNQYAAVCQTVKDQGLNCQYIPVVWVRSVVLMCGQSFSLCWALYHYIQ